MGNDFCTCNTEEQLKQYESNVSRNENTMKENGNYSSSAKSAAKSTPLDFEYNFNGRKNSMSKMSADIEKFENDSSYTKNTKSEIYTGPYLNDLYHGQGTLETDTEIYKGVFKLGKKSGYGELYHKDMTLIYEGEWKENKKDGNGNPYVI